MVVGKPIATNALGAPQALLGASGSNYYYPSYSPNGTFLIFNDGIGTIMRMATIYATELKIEPGITVASILIVQFVGLTRPPQPLVQHDRAHPHPLAAIDGGAQFWQRPPVPGQRPLDSGQGGAASDDERNHRVREDDHVPQRHHRKVLQAVSKIDGHSFLGHSDLTRG